MSNGLEHQPSLTCVAQAVALCDNGCKVGTVLMAADTPADLPARFDDSDLIGVPIYGTLGPTYPIAAVYFRDVPLRRWIRSGCHELGAA